jgi:N-methylhydantoinase A
LSRLVLGVDVGGTFTDFLLVDRDAGTYRVAKIPTTPADQSVGFLNGIGALEVAPDAIETIVHGTTIGTNAILERKGVACGLITTRGFRDVLELGRRTRPNAYGMIGSFEALIPRELRLEVTERVDAEGNVLTPLDEAEVRAAVEELARRGAEALVIHFIHAYINPSHEQRAAEIAAALWPNPYITTGSQVLPEFREFERGTTATLNAYIQPIIARYVDRLAGELSSRGFGHELLVMQGNGGMMDASTVAEHSAHTVMSGPAAGAIAAARTATRAGFHNVIGCDMGGTSFDVAVIRDGIPAVTSEKDLSYGVPIRVPMVDIHTIGAGGGSIARINRAGILQIGPDSAGSMPGPIGYGRGGTQVTVTDANMLLGRINLRRIPGVDQAANLEQVRDAIEEQVGRHLGLNAEQAAAAILTVANHQMAGAIRLVSIEKGADPRDFALFAFGGAGPLHATALARELGIPTVLVPRFPGITSALGCVLADVRHDFVQTINRPVQQVAPEAIDGILRDQAAAGRDLIEREGVRTTRVDAINEADLLYSGQTHVLRVPISRGRFDPDAVLRTFAEQYHERFDIELSEMRAILVNVRTTVIGRREGLDLHMFGGDGASAQASDIERRPVYFAGEWLETPVYRREALPIGATFDGPAVVEQLDTTTLIEPGCSLRIDEWGNLAVSVPSEFGG